MNQSADCLIESGSMRRRSAPHADGAFLDELLALRARIERERGPDDVQHLKKIERWGRWCTALGLATAWIAPNPLSAFLLSQGQLTRWTILGHHILHKSYDRIPEAPERLTSRRFAVGWRRVIDWMDWIVPAAWTEEHNLHHRHVGERYDPDLVEAHLQWLRRSKLPVPLRYGLVALMSATWKWAYYAPNTTSVHHEVRTARRRDGSGLVRRTSPYRADLWNPRRAAGRALWTSSILPYAALQFVLLPMVFLPLGLWAVASVLMNVICAEICTNIHSFWLIIPNHCGSDMSRFEAPAGSREQFYMRQIIGTVNYGGGDDWRDFLHGWLNYHIEHHLWPNLTLRQYQHARPRLRALCEKYDVPYVEESILRRATKALDIMVGRASMNRYRDPVIEDGAQALVA